MTPEPSGQPADQQILQLIDASNARAEGASEVPVEYIESGTFVGGEEDVYLAGIKRRDQVFVVKQSVRTEIPRANEAIRVLVEGIESERAHFAAGNWGRQAIYDDLLARTLAILKGIPQ